MFVSRAKVIKGVDKQKIIISQVREKELGSDGMKR